MDDINFYMLKLMNAFNKEKYFSPKISGSNTIELIYSKNVSALELKKMIDDNTGRVFPGISLEAMVLVLSYVPKDRLLSLNIACSILNQEYGQYIAFNVLECQDRLILYGSVKCTAQSDEIDTVLIGTLNAVFQIVINIRRRMSNGVLIDFNWFKILLIIKF